MNIYIYSQYRGERLQIIAKLNSEISEVNERGPNGGQLEL